MAYVQANMAGMGGPGVDTFDFNQDGDSNQADIGFFAKYIFEIGLGDVDGNGVVNTADIDPFVIALAYGPANEAGFLADPTIVANYPNAQFWNADGDYNGAVNTADIDVFVSYLSPPPAGSQSVPEPSSALLILGSLLGLLVIRKRK
jgi:hypothetical protein